MKWLLLPRLALVLVVFAGAGAGCNAPPREGSASPPAAEAEGACEAPEVRQAVERLGGRLKEVSLLAPDSVVARTIREAYAPLVTADLLAAWLAEPDRAPGRTVSSPWPERIEVHTVEPAGDGACRVEGDVVYVTSVELAQGGAAAREPVTVEVVEDDGWRVSAYEAEAAAETPADTTADTAAPDTAAATGAAAAADVVRRYYAAIEARDFRRAYGLWGDDGAASGQTFEAFAEGFAETAHVEAEVGEPGRVEGAAGSRYVEVPVTLRAVTDDGEAQHFEGTYTLRRAVVDGATAAQRRWHLYSADVRRTD